MKVVAALICMALGVPAAWGQAYPSKPIRVIVPAPPGSAPDFLSRLLAPKLGDMWGQPLVIDNVLGAGGNIGTDRVAKAPPDGYTLLFNTIGPIGVNISMYSNLPFDPVKDFAPITGLLSFNNILMVPAASPAKSVAELVAYAKTLYERQKPAISEAYPLARKMTEQADGVLEFANGSRIVGIPGGADQIRSYHPWGLFQDEAAFMPEAGKAYDHAVPVCQKIVVVSSAGPGWFADFVTDCG